MIIIKTDKMCHGRTLVTRWLVVTLLQCNTIVDTVTVLQCYTIVDTDGGEIRVGDVMSV